MYIKNPKEIEVKSFDIIEEVMEDPSFSGIKAAEVFKENGVSSSISIRKETLG